MTTQSITSLLKPIIKDNFSSSKPLITATQHSLRPPLIFYRFKNNGHPWFQHQKNQSRKQKKHTHEDDNNVPV